jgi:hypothetical protein
MHRTKRELLDYVPFVMLCLSLVVSLVSMWISEYAIQWQHYLGLIFLGCNALLFRRNHKQGVLFLGLTIVLGIIGFLAFQVGIVGASIYWTPFGFKIPIFAGNPILLAVFILHFIISNRYYDGILTKNYWKHINDSDWLWKNQGNSGKI